MDQQCSAIVNHIINCFSCLPLSLSYVPSLYRHWSMFDQWQSISTGSHASTSRHSDVASTHQHLAQNFNRPAPVALSIFCNLRTEVFNVNSQVGRYNCKAAWWSFVHDAPLRWPYVHVLLKFKLVPVSNYIKNIDHMGDGRCLDVHACQKLS